MNESFIEVIIEHYSKKGNKIIARFEKNIKTILLIIPYLPTFKSRVLCVR